MSWSQQFPPHICNSNWSEWNNFLVQVGVYDSLQSKQGHAWSSKTLGFSSHSGFQASIGCLLALKIFHIDTSIQSFWSSPYLQEGFGIVSNGYFIKTSAFKGQSFDFILAEWWNDIRSTTPILPLVWSYITRICVLGFWSLVTFTLSCMLVRTIFFLFYRLFVDTGKYHHVIFVIVRAQSGLPFSS